MVGKHHQPCLPFADSVGHSNKTEELLNYINPKPATNLN